MNKMYSLLSLASGALVVVANVPYIASILKGKTSPNRMSWFLWAVVGILILTTYHELDGKAAFFLALTGAICQMTVALLSIKYGSGGTSTVDRICLTLVILTCLIWWLTKSAFYPYVLAVFIDFLAIVPTMRKTYHKPDGEDLWAWIIWAIAALCAVLAIQTWTWAEALLPVYLLSAEIIMVLLILRGKLFVTSKSS